MELILVIFIDNPNQIDSECPYWVVKPAERLPLIKYALEALSEKPFLTFFALPRLPPIW